MADIYKSPAGKLAVESMYKAALARWPVPNQQLMIPTRHGDTFVIASGPVGAPPLVLFHGSGTNSSIWIRDVAEWARDFRVFAVDMIGEPGLSAASRPPLASDAYAAWLDEVWNGLGLTSAAIVGISLGGWLALDYAVRRPRRVSALSLLSPAGIGRQNRSTLLKAGLLLMLGSWGRRKSLGLIRGGGGQMSAAASDAVMTIFAHFRPRMEPLPIRTDEELASLSMPVQVIVGGRDALLRSEETRDRMQRLVPRLQLSYLEEAGHLLPPQTATVLAFAASQAAHHLMDRVGSGLSGRPDRGTP